MNELIKKFHNNELKLGTYNSTNENNENVIVEINAEMLKITTCQRNGWLRINCYYKDHTKEEFYEK